VITVLAQDVHKWFGKTHALRGVSLEVRPGEVLALLGPNGAGKTTLVKILATLLTKDSGHVEIMGHDLDVHVGTIRQMFGYVGQDTDRSAYARLTVAENLEFFGALRGLPRAVSRERIEGLARSFDFHENLHKPFMHLSGGQKQTVVAMRALLHDPPLIYLDEPTRGLDPIAAARLRAYLKSFVYEKGKSLLLTSHILSEVEDLATRVALIHQGRTVAAGDPHELKSALGAAGYVEVRKDRLPASVRERILQLDQVTSGVDRDPLWIAFAVDDGLAGSQAILHVLKASGVTAPFRYRDVSLEDVFAHFIPSAV